MSEKRTTAPTDAFPDQGMVSSEALTDPDGPEIVEAQVLADGDYVHTVIPAPGRTTRSPGQRMRVVPGEEVGRVEDVNFGDILHEAFVLVYKAITQEAANLREKPEVATALAKLIQRFLSTEDPAKRLRGHIQVLHESMRGTQHIILNPDSPGFKVERSPHWASAEMKTRDRVTAQTLNPDDQERVAAAYPNEHRKLAQRLIHLRRTFQRNFANGGLPDFFAADELTRVHWKVIKHVKETLSTVDVAKEEFEEARLVDSAYYNEEDYRAVQSRVARELGFEARLEASDGAIDLDSMLSWIDIDYLHEKIQAEWASLSGKPTIEKMIEIGEEQARLYQLIFRFIQQRLVRPATPILAGKVEGHNISDILNEDLPFRTLCFITDIVCQIIMATDRLDVLEKDHHTPNTFTADEGRD
jgi:hypothetical protein